MVTSASGEGDAPPRPDPVVVDIDPMSAVVFACVAVIALASWAIVTTAPDMVTRLAVGIVVGVALSPLVAGVQGRFGVRRGLAAAVVAGGLVLFFAARSVERRVGNACARTCRSRWSPYT